MRLINTKTLQLEEFIGSQIPGYAILSHTWGEGEVSFQEFTSTDRSACANKKGFAKIQNTCGIARAASIGYVWVDTCCIDKSSSAELTEAINSMFKWYAGSEICYAYLADLKLHNARLLSDTDLESKLRGCRWFTRGWTLQELIAPRLVRFYDSSWKWAFNKDQRVATLSSVTGIDPSVLEGIAIFNLLPEVPLARKMFWAASRQTTRTEDTAYCLMGIFDINMPLLYGEGEKAFRRLQEEIIKRSNDPSIYSWGNGASDQTLHGVLAASPRDFQTIGGLASDTVISTSRRGLHKLLLEESAVTNKGIRLKTILFRHGSGGHCMPLDYYVLQVALVSSNVAMDAGSYNPLNTRGRRYPFLHLSMIGPSTFARKGLIWSTTSSLSDHRVPSRSIYMTPYVDSSLSRLVSRSHRDAFLLRHNSGTRWSYRFGDVSPSDWFDDSRSLMFTFGSGSFVGHASCCVSAAKDGGIPQTFNIWVMFGTSDPRPWPIPEWEHWIDIGTDREFQAGEIQRRSVTRLFRCGEDWFEVTAELQREQLDGADVYVIILRIE